MNTHKALRRILPQLQQTCRPATALSMDGASLAKTLAARRWASSQEAVQATPKYSEATKKVVYGLAKMMGYYSKGSTAIRSSHSLYNVCAAQLETHREFYIERCKLPDNFQSWFSVTQLHVWMLMVHLRADKQGKMYMQELVNRFFEDAEARIRQHGLTQQKVINSYIKDFVAQFHGSVVAYDEGMCKDDPVLAAALWRNLFGPTTNDATELAYMVQYIRRELKALEAYDSSKLNAGIVHFNAPEATFPTRAFVQ